MNKKPIPPPVPSKKKECEHKFMHLETIKKCDCVTYGYIYKKIDRFYCEKCLKEKTIEKLEQNRGEKPDWY